MARKVLIGTVTLERDIKIDNRMFQYAASHELLRVDEGTYPIYAYDDDLRVQSNRVVLGWRNYIGYEGTVLEGNVGNRPGDQSSYHPIVYAYDLAEKFVSGHECRDATLLEYQLRPEWDIEIRDFCFNGKRKFSLGIVLKPETDIPYEDQTVQ